MDAIRTFFIGVMKVGLAIGCALLVVGGAIWAVSQFREQRTNRANAALASPKVWPEAALPYLAETKFRLKTIWRDGLIHYQFDVEGYPSNIARADKNDSSVSLNFVDKDGFELFSKRVGLASMTRHVDSDGSYTGMDWKGSEFIDADVYRRTANWEIATSGIPSTSPVEISKLDPLTKPKPVRAIPPPPPKPDPLWKNPVAWARLTHGMSKDMVRVILGEPDNTETKSSTTIWYYGLQPGRMVFFDQNGLVKSWTDY